MIRLLFLLLVMVGTFVQAQSREIPLRPGDQIGIQVSGIPPDEVTQISHNYRVSESGTIRLLHLKEEVSVAGVKPSELERKIASLYISKEIYTHPTVSVSIDATGTERVIYVSGAVTKPGQVPMRPGLTVSKAIAFAGGKTTFGKLSKVKLVRGGKPVGTLNLERAGSPDADTLLEPEDEVVVPD